MKQIIPNLTYKTFLEAVAEINPKIAKLLKERLSKPMFDKKQEIDPQINPYMIFDDLRLSYLRNYKSEKEVLEWAEIESTYRMLNENFNAKYDNDTQMKNSQIKYANKTEAKQKNIDNLDLEKIKDILSKEIKTTLNLPIRIEELSIKDKESQYTKILFKTNDFASKTSPKMFKEVYLETFGSEINDNGCFFNIQYHLIHEDNGSNWASFASVSIVDNELAINYSTDFSEGKDKTFSLKKDKKKSKKSKI